MRRAYLIPLLLMLGLPGCYESILVNPGIECPVTAYPFTVAMPRAREVDLLFVVDNSNSMAHAQHLFRTAFPRFVEAIVTGDPDGDGVADFPPVESLRAVVITTDMGVLGVGRNPGEPRFGTCGLEPDGIYYPERASYGDDAVLVSRASREPELDCDIDGDGEPDLYGPAVMPEFLTFDPRGEISATEYGRRFGCFATVGTGGCGFEQPLEAALKALTPRTSSTRFFALSGDDARRFGRGDDPETNGGFVREDSVLGVIVLSDEDDCSASHPAVIDYTDPRYRDPLGGAQFATRCQRYPELLHPISRYVNGLLALRERTSHLVFAAIAGVPPELTDDSAQGEGVDNLAAVLDAPSMQHRYTRDERGVPLAGLESVCEICDDARGNQNGRCDEGFNDANEDGIDAPDCIDIGPPNGVCDPGELPNCTADSNGNGICDLEDVELAFVDTNGNFMRDPGERDWINEHQIAWPARRITEVAEGLRARGASVLMRTICDSTFDDTIVALATRVSSALRTSCLPTTITPVEGAIPCRLVEILKEGYHCDERAGRTFLRRDGLQEVCLLEQLVVSEEDRLAERAPAGTGWFYDDYTRAASALCGTRRLRVALTDDIDPRNADLRLECEESVESELFGPEVGDPCERNADCEMTALARQVFLDRYGLRGRDFPSGRPLVCSPLDRTCRIPCDRDEVCPSGQLCADPDDASYYEGNVWPSICSDVACFME